MLLGEKTGTVGGVQLGAVIQFNKPGLAPVGLEWDSAEEQAGTTPGTEQEAISSVLLGKRGETWSSMARMRKDLRK